MSLRPRALPAGFIAPCLPVNAQQPPSSSIWLHEIKWDGFRVIGRKTGKRVKPYADTFTQPSAAASAPLAITSPVESCQFFGEACLNGHPLHTREPSEQFYTDATRRSDLA
jgi:hypothetical protein